MAKPRFGSEAWRESISRAKRAAEDARRWGPVYLRQARQQGQVQRQLSPLIRDAERTVTELLDQYGGPEHVPPAKRSLIETGAGLLLAFKAETRRYLRTSDPEALDRLPSLANALRLLLRDLGLDWKPIDVTNALGDAKLDPKGAIKATWEEPVEPEVPPVEPDPVLPTEPA